MSKSHPASGQLQTHPRKRAPVAVVHPDRAIAQLAARQHGVVAVRQLLAAGLGRGAIETRRANGRLHPLHRGVYLVGHPIAPVHARELAAVLACGDGAVLSHRSAAVLWGLLPPLDDPLHVTVVGRGAPRRPGVHAHRARELRAGERGLRHGIPVTSPARTLLDLAEAATSRELERAYDEALTKKRVTRNQIHSLIVRSPGRRGTAALRALLSRDTGPAITRSEAEERMLELIRRARLPQPQVNVRVAGHEVDFLWAEAGLVVEVDGYAFHSTPKAFETDRRRDAELQAQGLRVLRFTWRQIVYEPEAVIARIAGSLRVECAPRR